MGVKEIKKGISNIQSNKGQEQLMYDSQEDIREALQVLVDISKTKHGLKDSITADYIYAHLSEKEKEFIVEWFADARFAKNIITRGVDFKVHRWDNIKKDWERNEDNSIKEVDLDEVSKAKILKSAQSMFDIYMEKPHLLVTLARNDKDNFLIKLLVGGLNKDETITTEVPEEKGFFQKIKEKLGFT